MQTISFTGEKREVNGDTKALRNEGKIPAVLYGAGVLEHFSVTMKEIKKLIFTPDFKIGEVSVGSDKHQCIIKDIQWHPVTDEIRHIDFLTLKAGTKVKIEIPVRFKGASPGVLGGGKLIQSMRRVKVKLDPADIVDELLIDISELELGNSVRVRDIEVSDKIEILANESIPVAGVEVPRALKSAEAEEAEGEDDAATPEAAEAPAE